MFEHNRLFVAERVLDDVIPQPAAPGSSISMREADWDEILSFASKTMGYKHDGWARTLAYLSRHYRCALGSMDDKPIGWCWWLDNRILQENVEPDRQLSFCSMTLEDSDAWCFAFEIPPSLRRHGLSPTMLREFERLALQNGYRRILSCFDAKNIPARRLWEGSGYRAIRNIGFYTFASRLGISGQRVFVRVQEDRDGFTTFPYRLLRDPGQSRRRGAVGAVQ